MQSKKFGSATLLSITTIIIATLLVGCGQSNEQKASDTPPETTAPTTSETPAPSSNVATATATTGNGEKVYQASCRVCHDTGNLGSPRMGDKSAWQPRIAQGKETLYTHAIQGFTGKTGTMPPKGTSNAPDADIKSAVDYIVAKSQ